MKKILSIFTLCTFFSISAFGDTAITKSTEFTNAESYSTMYPFMSRKMRQKLNPGTTSDMAEKAISTLVKTGQPTTKQKRSVVSRSAKKSTNTATKKVNNTYRAATNSKTTNSTSATQTKRNVVKRSSTNKTTVARSASTNNRTSNRTVVARKGKNTVRSNRIVSTTTSSTTSSTTTGTNVSSQRCYSDYSECMDSYCQRENTAYNRCYCSAKLAQIDARYQSDINASIQTIVKLKNTSSISSEEINDYWMSVMGDYVSENSWKNIDDALDIDWSTTESRVRGQNAFNIGHEYCVQHLTNCFYMSSNLRDAYKSEIARDCEAYETGLQNLQSVIESVIESYNE